jgi:hypothetical protein
MDYVFVNKVKVGIFVNSVGLFFIPLTNEWRTGEEMTEQDWDLLLHTSRLSISTH